jgi:hypothetical protein
MAALSAVAGGLPREVGAEGVEVEKGRDLLEEGKAQFRGAVVEDFAKVVASAGEVCHGEWLLFAFASVFDG